MAPADEQTARQTAGAVMTPHPTCGTCDTPLERVAQLMVLQGCGEIPVVEDDQARVPIAVVTDRDIVCRLPCSRQESAAVHRRSLHVAADRHSERGDVVG
jgi:CBS domain-containing protein